MSKALYPVVDIFAGPGGLGEGFASYSTQGGTRRFRIALSIEKDPKAHRTLLLRSFFRKFPEPPRAYYRYVKGEISQDELFKKFPRQFNECKHEACLMELSSNTHSEACTRIRRALKGARKWVLIGGPPCQAYSVAGRSRMKSTVADFEKDDRHTLYREYLRVLHELKPPLFVMENVKGLLSSTLKGQPTFRRIVTDLERPSVAMTRRASGLRYNLFPLSSAFVPGDELCPESFIVRAENHGVPQRRHRVFLLGVRADLDIRPGQLSYTSPPSAEDVLGDLPRIRSTLSREADSVSNWIASVSEVVNQAWFQQGLTNGLAQTTGVINRTIATISSEQLSIGGSFLSYEKKPARLRDWYSRDSEGLADHESRAHMRSDIHRYLFAASYASANGVSPYLRDFPPQLLPRHKNVPEALGHSMFANDCQIYIFKVMRRLGITEDMQGATSAV